MILRPRKRSFPASGFSLVETVMAIGITVYAMAALLGMMTVALSQIGNAQNGVVLAELGDRLVSTASQMDFSQVGHLPGQTALFDASGLQTANRKEAIYEISWTSVSDLSIHSKAVILEIHHTQGSPGGEPLVRFVCIVSDNGR